MYEYDLGIPNGVTYIYATKKFLNYVKQKYLGLKNYSFLPLYS